MWKPLEERTLEAEEGQTRLTGLSLLVLDQTEQTAPVKGELRVGGISKPTPGLGSTSLDAV